jgi:colanic acid/amylovoran biosynthesis glycosyltransferase
MIERGEVSSIAIQRCDTFVGRTQNWVYDHLRFLPNYTPLVLCDLLENREEFPELEAWFLDRESLPRRVWTRLTGSRLLPNEFWKLKQRNPRVLHSHFGYVAVGDLQLHQSLDIPWVVGFYGADVYQVGHYPGWEARYDQVFSRAAKILALGPVMAQELKKLGCPEHKVVIHALGVDTKSLPWRPRILGQKETLKVLFAGNAFREKKGVRYLIEGAALARQAGVNLQLCIVGGGKIEKSGEEKVKEDVFGLISRLGLEEITSYHPFVPFRELHEIALASHVFVAPSITATDGDSEGTPFVVQQMMATSMPVIATMHSDNPYLFGRHSHLLVPERDAQAIAERLQSFAENPELLTSVGTTLREQIGLEFDVRICASRLSNIYTSIQ